MGCSDKIPNVKYKNHSQETARFDSVSPSKKKSKRYFEESRRKNNQRMASGYSENSSCTEPDNVSFEKRKKKMSKRVSEDSIESIYEQLKQEMEEKQKLVDDYILNKGLNYFQDFCTCSMTCLLYHLWHDEFVRDTINAVIFFGVGIKLCYELDGIAITSI